ncbi:MAG: hypothetical protein A2148_04515, partial [Chloroflexi bacterium RBG_16_68_14]
MLLLFAGWLLTVPSAPVAAQETVRISLTEFVITADPASADEGLVTFQVSNTGAIVHDFRVIRTDLPPGALPVVPGEYIVDEGQVNVVASSAVLEVGQAGEVSATLGPGSYVLICNIPTHYQGGMRLAFPVRAAPEPTSTLAPGEPTPTPGATGGTPTPAAAGPDLPITGQGPSGGPTGWWMPAILAA